VRPLYEIAAEFKAMIDTVEALDDGVIPEELQRQVVESREELVRKLENCMKARRNREAHAAVLEAQAKEFADEAKRLRGAAKVQDNKATSFNRYVAIQMKMAGVRNIETSVGTIFLSARPRVEITDEKLVPSKYWKQIPTIDKQLLNADVLAGNAVSGVTVRTDDVLSLK